MKANWHPKPHEVGLAADLDARRHHAAFFDASLAHDPPPELPHNLPHLRGAGRNWYRSRRHGNAF
jgi:hypothetical protein